MDAPAPPDTEGHVNAAVGDASGRMIARKATMAGLAGVLAMFLKRPVVGYYDFDACAGAPSSAWAQAACHTRLGRRKRRAAHLKSAKPVWTAPDENLGPGGVLGSRQNRAADRQLSRAESTLPRLIRQHAHMIVADFDVATRDCDLPRLAAGGDFQHALAQFAE